jgi:hypothetical protein
MGVRQARGGSGFGLFLAVEELPREPPLELLLARGEQLSGGSRGVLEAFGVKLVRKLVLPALPNESNEQEQQKQDSRTKQEA